MDLSSIPSKMNIQASVPYLLLVVVLICCGTSVIYMANISIGDQNTRNELQKHISILASVNALLVIFLGFGIYYYLQSKPNSVYPFMITLLTFNTFLGIMAISIATLQKLS